MTSQFSLPQIPITVLGLKTLLRKSLLIVLIGGIVLFSLPDPAYAASCRNIKGRRICEASLNRTAKIIGNIEPSSPLMGPDNLERPITVAIAFASKPMVQSFPLKTEIRAR